MCGLEELALTVLDVLAQSLLLDFGQKEGRHELCTQ
jgi:hypothetical protein